MGLFCVSWRLLEQSTVSDSGVAISAGTLCSVATIVFVLSLQEVLCVQEVVTLQKKYYMYLHQKMSFTPFFNYYDILG